MECTYMLLLPPNKSVFENKNVNLIFQQKHMLWVLKRTVSMRHFFWAPTLYASFDGYENKYYFTLKNIA